MADSRYFKERDEANKKAVRTGRRQIAAALELRGDIAPEPARRKGRKRKAPVDSAARENEA